jgi:hypothetical protein
LVKRPTSGLGEVQSNDEAASFQVHVDPTKIAEICSYRASRRSTRRSSVPRPDRRSPHSEQRFQARTAQTHQCDAHDRVRHCDNVPRLCQSCGPQTSASTCSRNVAWRELLGMRLAPGSGVTASRSSKLSRVAP